MAVGTGGNRVNFDLKPFDNSAMANGFLSAYQNNMNQVSDFMKNAANMNIQAQTVSYAMAKLEDEYKRNQYNFRVGEEKWKLFEQQLEADQWVRENWEQLYDKSTGRFRRDAIDKLRAALPNNSAAIPLLMNYAKGMSTEKMMETYGERGYFTADPYVDPNTVVATSHAVDNNSGKGGAGGAGGTVVQQTPGTDRIGTRNYNKGLSSNNDTQSIGAQVPSFMGQDPSTIIRNENETGSYFPDVLSPSEITYTKPMRKGSPVPTMNPFVQGMTNGNAKIYDWFVQPLVDTAYYTAVRPFVTLANKFVSPESQAQIEKNSQDAISGKFGF
jgi:hypothetical protein